MTITLGSLCSGFGGLDLGLERAGFTVAWHVELSPACATVLDAHWPVPNHRDLKTTDWSTVEPVDAICGGYPCQPFSHAGRRLGENDERHLWPYVCAAIRALRPRLAILENVAGHRSLGFGRVLGDLAEIGYDATWGSIRASDVGAPHGRERVFILAAPADAGCVEHERRRGLGQVAGAAGKGEGGQEERQRVRDAAGGSRAALADTGEFGCDGREGQQGEGREAAERGQEGDLFGNGGRSRSRDALAYTYSGGCFLGGEQDGGQVEPGLEAPRRGDPDRRHAASVAWGEYAPAIHRWERAFGERAPLPLDERGRLNVDLTRWMMGFPPGWHGSLPRTKALRGYGNAVQVQVAEHVGRWAAA